MDKAPDAFRTISEVAEDLDLPQHVLRFWETRFSQIRPMKRGGGRRYYRVDDVELLRGIRHLLYGEGYTIRGVQRILKDHGIKFVQGVWRTGAPQPSKSPGDVEEPRIDDASDDVQGSADIAAEPAQMAEGEGRREPTFDAPDLAASPRALAQSDSMSAPASNPPSRQGGLTRDELRKLQATLYELSECRRLIDAVLAEGV